MSQTFVADVNKRSSGNLDNYSNDTLDVDENDLISFEQMFAVWLITDVQLMHNNYKNNIQIRLINTCHGTCSHTEF